MTDEFRTIFVLRSRRFEQFELDIVRPYLLAMYPRCCMRCCQPLAKLDSVIQVDHINGNHYDCRLLNLQLLCESCNKTKYHEEDKINKDKSEMNYEQKVFTKSPKLLMEFIFDRIKKTGHCCYEEAITDGAKYAKCHMVTAKGYIKMELGSELGKLKKVDFKCDSPICEGESLFKKNETPVKISGEDDESAVYILKIEEDDGRYDIVDKTIDKYLIRTMSPEPTSFEQDVYHKFNLRKTVTSIFKNITNETNYFRSLDKKSRSSK